MIGPTDDWVPFIRASAFIFIYSSSLFTSLKLCYSSRLALLFFCLSECQCTSCSRWCCLSLLAQIGTACLIPPCACFLISRGIPVMNIHLKRSAWTHRLINIQKALIDYRVSADMCFSATVCWLDQCQSDCLSTLSSLFYPRWEYTPLILRSLHFSKTSSEPDY